jgi:hypothetical protein
MAEHTTSGAPELGAPMDYQMHRQTYAGFIALIKVGILASIVTLIALALYGFGSGGFWLGTILLVLLFIGCFFSFVGRGAIRPLLVILVIGVILAVLSLG